MFLSIINKKRFSIRIKKNVYNLIVINKNLILSKNKKVNKKIELLLIVT